MHIHDLYFDRSRADGRKGAVDKSKRPSPPGQASVTLADGKTITIDYSRPSAKGRQVFGGLVPYGKEWRTGANEATTFVTTTDLMVGDKHVPAGNYTLYTIPNQQQWTLIINKQTGQWGTVYDEKQDLVRVPMKVSKTSRTSGAVHDLVETGWTESRDLKPRVGGHTGERGYYCALRIFHRRGR